MKNRYLWKLKTIIIIIEEKLLCFLLHALSTALFYCIIFLNAMTKFSVIIIMIMLVLLCTILEWIYVCFEFPLTELLLLCYCCLIFNVVEMLCAQLYSFLSIIILNTLFLLRQIIWSTKFFLWFLLFRVGFSHVLWKSG